MAFKNIFFDFDGTIADTSEGVYKSFDYVINFYGVNFDHSEYKKLIGPPLKESFENILHLPKTEIQNAIKKYREYYTPKGVLECKIYDGILDLIKSLKAKNYKICVATSKPEHFARQILEHFQIANLFDFIGGSSADEKSRVEKVDVVRYVMEKNNFKSDECILIGDRKYDVEGAHQAGIKCMGILWGFGNRKEFEECGADYICATVKEADEFFEGV